MSLPFAIEQRLTASHLTAFQRRCASRSFTVDLAWVWLTERGYQVSRGAVGNYIQQLRSGELSNLRGYLGLKNDGQCRRQIRQWCGQLSGDTLSIATFFIAQLAGAMPGKRITSRGHSRGRVASVLGHVRRPI